MARKLRHDFSEWTHAFKRLKGEVRESLGRRMAVAGARVLRDAARANARTPGGPWGAERRGLWARAMYVAYDRKNSTGTEFTYNVSWKRRNGRVRKKPSAEAGGEDSVPAAPHGHLLEFGHWQPYKVYRAPNGEWYTATDAEGNPVPRPDGPRWVPAYPALGPAFDSHAAIAMRVAIDTGRRELPGILLGNAS